MGYKFLVTYTKIKSTECWHIEAKSIQQRRSRKEAKTHKDDLVRCALIFLNFQNKLSQTEGLNTTGIYSLPVLEARIIKPKCQPG